MPAAVELGVGFWWRFTRYELRDGYIRPAVGANLERSDPWAGDGVYSTLLELLRSPGLFPPTSEGEQRVLDWVAQHGLLGILPHESLSATLPPRWHPFWSAWKSGEPFDPTELTVTVFTYLRTPTGWATRTNVPLKPMALLKDEPAQLNAPVAQSLLTEMLKAGALIAPAGVIRQPIGGEATRQEPISTAWGTFFPDVPPEERERFAYPPPLSDDFWRSYAEPLPTFLMAAAELRRALEALAGLRKQTQETRGAAQRGSRELANLLTPVNAVPMLDGDAVSIRWASGSLLATCAMQAALALSGDGRVIICTCGKLFISDDHRAIYCSPKCRWRTHQKMYRANKGQRAKRRKRGTR